MRAGFVFGNWRNYGYSDEITLELSDKGGNTGANAVDLGDWEPPSEDEFFE